MFAEILGEVAGLERVPVDSNFFDDLGADPLVMARFCARVRKREELPSVPMEDIYRNPTIRSLASALGNTVPAASAEPPVRVAVEQPKPVRTAGYVVCGTLQLLFLVGYAYLADTYLREHLGVSTRARSSRIGWAVMSSPEPVDSEAAAGLADVRWNDGGDDALALQAAWRLINTAYVAYIKAARVDPHDPARHGPGRPVIVMPADGPRYTGPIRLLISDLPLSAGETFTEALMGRAPAPTRIGSTTQGAFSDDMERTLSNGWTFTLGNEEYLAHDGQNYEGVGIPPSLQVPVFTPAELAQHQDSALGVPW